MRNIFTLSAYETDAEHFFNLLMKENTDLVLDVRLKNSSQLCGFTKEKDLAYLIPKITNAIYVHDLRFAPSSALLESYLKHAVNWEIYSSSFIKEMKEKDAAALFEDSYEKYQSICILGTATKNRRSHSEVLEKMFSAKSK